MNHIYRSIRDERTGSIIAVAETTRARGKGSSRRAGVASSGFVLRSLAACVALAHGSIGQASPVDGNVVAGNASISSTAGNTTITQTSENVALDWQSFDIGIGESVRFVQPGSSSVALNRVLGNDPSRILGSLSANGQVFLVNPHGILFGTGAQVNVGGLIASTRNISDSDFMAGRYSFSGASDAAVSNQGSINAQGGYVALLGAQVNNQGVIAAKLGNVSLAAGNAFTLDVAADGLLNVTVSEGAVNALVQNGGLIQADGGHVLLTARSAGDLLPSAVNNTGLIQAQAIENRNGVIKLLGDMRSGSVNVGGTLDASAPNGGNGGFVDTSAAHVRFSSDAVVTTAAPLGTSGLWLIDPVDFTIAASGGDMTGALLSSSLGLGNVVIQSSSGATGVNGDIHVNDTVTWSANQLTLDAFRDININTAMYGSGTASLALNHGQGAAAAGNTAAININAAVNLPAGNNFSTKLGSDGAVLNYTVITSLGAPGSVTGTDLQGMNGNLAGRYVLGSDIDASATSGWNGGAGFSPIGGVFSGTFNGLNHSITGLTINQATSYMGLFRLTVASTSISNVALINGSVTGVSYAGSLVGRNAGSIRNSFATTNVSGSSYAGGLVGYQMAGGTIDNSYAAGAVTSTYAGGMVGFNQGTISNSYAAGAVNGTNSGGLVGLDIDGTVANGFWNITTSGRATSAAGVGLTTAQMQAALPAGFSSAIWGNGGDHTTPYLRGNPGLVLIDSDTSSTYYTPVSGIGQLQAMSGDLAGHYALINDVDASATSGWNAGAGFAPIGDNATPFSGSFDGLGHTISHLTINRPTTDYVGLFGSTSGAQLHNVGLIDVNITGQNSVGALAGATVVGSATGNHATGQVSGQNRVGGLLGYNNTTAVSSSYTTTAVSGSSDVGGLMGETNGGIVSSSNYATGNVTGSGSRVGGLVGFNGFSFVIRDSYATGNVTASADVGGLVGSHYNGEIANTYSTGSVSGTTNVGGLVGVTGGGLVNSSFWNIDTSGQATSAGGTGLTTTQMRQQASFSGWNFSNDWISYEGYSDPLLRTFMTNLMVTADNAARAYDGTAYSGGNGVTYSVAPNGNLLGSLSYGGSSQGAANAGSYVVTASGLYSNQQGYAISYSSGTLTIDPAILTATALSFDKIYDGNTLATATFTGLTGLIGAETLGASVTGSFNSKDVATANLATVDAVTLTDGANGGLASNYTLAVGPTVAASISARELTATAAATDKVYDGSTTVGASGTAAFNSKDVATANVVTIDSVVLTDGDNGGLASNYTLASGQTASANITARELAATFTAADKIYDGNTNAGVTVTALTGLVGSESLDVTSAATFNSKDVATANLVTVNSTLLTDGDNGGLAGNYRLAGGQTAVASITPKALTVSGETALDKLYDGTTTATLTGGSLIGVVAGETVDLVEAGDFATADIGSAIAVTATNSLRGEAAANYILVQPAGLSAAITAAPSPPVVTPPVVPPPVVSPPVLLPDASYVGALGHVTATAMSSSTSSGGGHSPSSLSSAPSAPIPSTSPSMGLTGLDLTVIGKGIHLPQDAELEDRIGAGR
jgi:filamentous hemagglutinin family protein